MKQVENEERVNFLQSCDIINSSHIIYFNYCLDDCFKLLSYSHVGVLEEHGHVVLVDWVLQQSRGLWGLNLGVELDEGHSNLSSGISAAAEAEVLNDIVLWVGRVEDLLIVSTVTIAKVLAWLLIGVKVLGSSLEVSGQLQVGSLAQLLLLLDSGSDLGAS